MRRLNDELITGAPGMSLKAVEGVRGGCLQVSGQANIVLPSHL